MTPALLGKKVGMTRVYDEKGVMTPVTVVQCEPNNVTQVKTVENDGYHGVQLGYFPTQQLGILFSQFFGWRDNQLDATLFETRSMLELQYLPIRAGLFHAGLFGAGGYAWRFEDAVKLAGPYVVATDDHTPAFEGGAMLQLDINTRVALTARLGLGYAHGERMSNLMFGLSVY